MIVLPTHVGFTRSIGRWMSLILLMTMLPGCITTRVMTEPDCDTPEGVSYSQKTVTAYFWGFKQPVDLKPPCDPRFNHLNGITVKSTFAHYMLSTITLGIVNKRQVRWCCAPYVPQRDSL
ncbi:hypothetical protein GO755_10075 [Spirosoma sp. HMF4905]|uniref:Uncharacterized protein n=1 Tax=Spirosoma arboris TaxID=2682092 RepID=A0A7K1S9D8_9BACT|nr:hypothetical protein [Spirosoma arboris]MVM30380.1 hypothetical protein [Spirosoma arboris]